MWVAAGHTAVQQSRHHSLTPYMASERCEAVSRQSANILHCPPWNTSATAQLSYQSHCSIQYIIAYRSQFHLCTLLTINVHIQYIYIYIYIYIYLYICIYIYISIYISISISISIYLYIYISIYLYLYIYIYIYLSIYLYIYIYTIFCYRVYMT